MKNGKRKKGRAADIVLVAAFALGISLPLFGALRSAGGTAPRARRGGAAGFEELFSHRLGLREPLLRRHARWGLALRGHAAGVLLGRDGWLFHLEPPYSASVVARSWKELDARVAGIRRRGVRYLFVAAPAKAAIYPEMLPKRIPFEFEGWTRNAPIERFLEGSRGGSRVPVLDLRTSLLEAKRLGRLYYKGDIHWNDLGAFVAVRRVVRRLRAWFPGLKASSLSDFERRAERADSSNLSKKLGLADILAENTVVLEPRRSRRARRLRADGRRLVFERQGRRLRAVVIYDSFGNRMIPFLAELFGRTVFVGAEEPWPAELIARERPDLVLHVGWDRNAWFMAD